MTLVPRRAAAVLACAALVFGLAACGSDEGGGPADPIDTESASPSTSPSASESPSESPAATVTTPTETGDPLKDAVVSGYVGFINAVTAAFEQVARDLPALVTYANGTALQSTQAFVDDLASRQHRTVGPITISPEVLSAASSVAVVQDCLDQSQSRTLDTGGNDVTNPNQPARVPFIADLQLSGSVWQVTSWTAQEGQTC